MWYNLKWLSGWAVEGLYSKRPIQCLASSKILKILTPHPPHCPASVYPTPPPANGAGGGHTRWAERGWGVNSLEDARHCSVLYLCNYLVEWAVSHYGNYCIMKNVWLACLGLVWWFFAFLHSSVPYARNLLKEFCVYKNLSLISFYYFAMGNFCSICILKEYWSGQLIIEIGER